MVWLFKRRRAVVEEPFHVARPTGGSYIIPAGFEFDGGSVPRWLLIVALLVSMAIPMAEWFQNIVIGLVCVGLLIDSFGIMLPAFAIHDFAVRYGVLVRGNGSVEYVGSVSQANNIMRRVNFATNDMIRLGWIAHLGVMLGAWRAWQKYRRDQVTRNEWQEHDYGVDVCIGRREDAPAPEELDDEEE